MLTACRHKIYYVALKMGVTRFKLLSIIQGERRAILPVDRDADAGVFLFRNRGNFSVNND